MNEISAATLEQTSGIDQVNLTVNNMESFTQQNASLAEETSAAAMSMQDQTGQMSRLLGFFNLGERYQQQTDGQVTSAADTPASIGSLVKNTGTSAVGSSHTASALSQESTAPARPIEELDDGDWEEF